jgi:hypothetical protein
MATGLIIVAVSKKKNKDITITSQKTLLLSTDRILDMCDNSSNKAVFYYDIWASQDNKDVPSNFTCTDYSCGQLHWVIKTADTSNSRFFIHVEYEDRVTGGRNQRKIDKMIKLFANQIIYGWDDPDGLHSHIVITRGSNIYRLKTSHTLTDIVRTSSKSESLSASLLSGGSTGGREQ